MSDHEINETSSDSEEAEDFNIPKFDSLYGEQCNDPLYVDKTLLIKELFKVHHVLITAPSRFCKSVNMSMVRSFVEIELDKDKKPIELDVDEDKGRLKKVQKRSQNFQLFKGKKIFKDKQFVFQHFGKYPTIYINFRRISTSFEEALASLRTAINDAFRIHSYLYYSSLWDHFDKKIFMRYINRTQCELLSEDELKSGLKLLSKLLHSHYGRKVFVFIEGFDSLLYKMIACKYVEFEDKQKTIDFYQLIIQNLLKDNEFVERSLLNGYQQLGSLLLGSVNNVARYGFMQKHNFAEFYGFEETEVIDLLKKAKKLEDLNELRQKHNGYKTTLEDGRHIQIYDPLAILRYLTDRHSSTYYWSAGFVSGINYGIAHFKIKPKISEILCGELVKIKYVKKFSIKDFETLCNVLNKGEIDEDGVDLFIQFLYEQNLFYHTDSGDDYLKLSIPNTTVYDEIDQILSNIDRWKI